jgi:hypothetical protein
LLQRRRGRPRHQAVEDCFSNLDLIADPPNDSTCCSNQDILAGQCAAVDEDHRTNVNGGCPLITHSIAIEEAETLSHMATSLNFGQLEFSPHDYYEVEDELLGCSWCWCQSTEGELHESFDEPVIT